MIFDTFYVGRVWWFWRKWFLTVSTLGGCGGLERTDFWHFLLWEGMVVLKELIFNSFLLQKGVVVLKELIFDTFYFGKVWWSWKNWFLIVSMLGGCGGLERTDFWHFLLWEGMVVLNELIFKLILNVFYFRRVCVVLKELIFDTFYFGKLWWSWKKLIFNVFYFRRVLWPWKNWFLIVSMLGGCGGFERNDF